MNTEPINRFQQELEKAVGRFHLKRLRSQVDEVVGHFSDLLSEGETKGLSPSDAAFYARGKIGDVSEIASQLNLPDKVMRGKRLQIWAVIAWILIFFTPYIIGMIPNRPADGNWRILDFFIFNASNFALAMGFIFAFGILKSKRVSLVAISAAAVLFPVCWLTSIKLAYHSFENYERISLMGHQELKKYKEIVEPKFLATQAAIRSNLENPSDSSIAALTTRIKNDHVNGFLIQGNKTGKYVYPTAFQKVLPDRLPWIFMTTTDSKDTAIAAWKGADRLLATFPQMESATREHFDGMAKFSFEPRLAVQTFQLTVNALKDFFLVSIVATALLWMLSGIANTARRMRRPAL